VLVHLRVLRHLPLVLTCPLTPQRVSGIFGPIIYGWIVWVSGARTGLIGLAIMSVPGIALMLSVDFEAGRQCSESTPIDQDSGPDELE